MIDTQRLAALTAPTGLPSPESAGAVLNDIRKICRAALRCFLRAPAVTVTRHGEAIDIYDRELVRMIALNGEFIATQYRPLAARPKKAGSPKGRARRIAPLEQEHLFRYEGALFNCHMAPGG